MANSIRRLPAVKDRTGLGRSNIYSQIAEGTFPKPISLGARAVGWLESDIDNWIASRVEASRKTSQEIGSDKSQVPVPKSTRTVEA